MPTYDYICTACEHAWEHYQGMTEKPIRKCPECGKNKAERQMGTGAGVIFKGSGFYTTDYRSESYKKGAEAAKPKDDSKSESKSEAKAETKTESKSTGSDDK